MDKIQENTASQNQNKENFSEEEEMSTFELLYALEMQLV